jgi:hypothetical protein
VPLYRHKDQIAQLPIENLLSLDEAIVDEDADIFTTVLGHCAVARQGEEEESSDEEEVEEVNDAEALRSIQR